MSPYVKFRLRCADVIRDVNVANILMPRNFNKFTNFYRR